MKELLLVFIIIIVMFSHVFLIKQNILQLVITYHITKSFLNLCSTFLNSLATGNH